MSTSGVRHGLGPTTFMAVLVVVLAGCGGGGPAPAAAPTTRTTTVAPGGAAKLGVAPGQTVVVTESPAASPTDSTAPTTSEVPPPAVEQAGAALQQSVVQDAALPAAPDDDDYPDYTRLAQPLGAWSFEHPTVWAETTAYGAPNGKTVAIAAPNFDAYNLRGGLGVQIVRPGGEGAAESALASRRSEYYSKSCNSPGPERPYSDRRFEGIVQTFTSCGGRQEKNVVLAVRSTGAGPTFAGTIEMVVQTERDAAALARAVSSLQYS